MQSRRHQTPEKNYGKRPEDSRPNTTGIFTKFGSWDNASDEQSQCAERNGREGNHERSDKVFDDGVLGLQVPKPTQNTRTTKMQVTNVALQTDSCDTLYVTKNTLVAYTIAVVQNSKMLQYDQMHVALQMAKNQASLKTSLRAEQLMTAHFNLVVLSNETKINETINAQNPKPLLLTLHHPHQLLMRRLTSRFQVGIIVQIVIQRGYTLQELSYQPVEENTDLLMATRQVMKLMILGIRILFLMSRSTLIHIHTT